MKLKVNLLCVALLPGVWACSQQGESGFDRSGTWKVDGNVSSINFVTTKAGTVSELGSIGGLSGSIEESGSAEIEFALDSTNTGIETRDERMKEFLFDTAQFPVGKVTAQIDPATLDSLASGGGGALEIEATVTIAGASAPVTLPLAVATVGKDRVLVQTSKPVLVEASTFNLTDGVEKLRELASLDAIAPVVPVTVSVTFARQ